MGSMGAPPMETTGVYPAVNTNKSPHTPRSYFLTFLFIKDRTTSVFKVMGKIPGHFHSYSKLNQKVHCGLHQGFGRTPLL